MADQLHFALSKFRTTMLSAVAELEFELRDQIRPVSIYPTETHTVSHDAQIEELAQKIEFLEVTLKQVLSTSVTPRVEIQSRVEELLKVEPVANSRNVLVSVRNTPALEAAVIAAQPPEFDLETEEDEEAEEIVEEEEDEEEDEVVEEEEEVVEEEKEEEEEEEAIEVEEFEYKGKTYQRDAEGTVYLDGEEIGTWNGKKIILT